MAIQSSIIPFIGYSIKPDIIKYKTFPFLYKNFYSGVNTSNLIFAYPGRGKIGNDNCGKFSTSYSCKCRTTVKHIFHSCYKLSCPICYQKGIQRNAHNTAYRLIKLRKITRKEFYHISFNVMWKIKTPEQFIEAKAKLIKILRENNMHGLLIFHEGRVKTRKKTERWKTDPSRLKNVKVVKQLTHSPHFHFIGIGMPMNAAIFYKKYGFTYANITLRNKSDGKRWKLRSRGAFKRLVAYLLSHSALVKNRHTIVWFNQFSYNRVIKLDYKRTETNTECPTCGSLLYEIEQLPLKIEGNYFKGFLLTYQLNYTINLDKVHRSVKETYKLRLKNKSLESNYNPEIQTTA